MPYNLEGAKGAYCRVFAMYIYSFFYLFVGMFGFTVQSVIVYGDHLSNSMCCLHNRVHTKWLKVLATTNRCLPLSYYHK